MKYIYKIVHVKSQMNQTIKAFRSSQGKTHNGRLRQRGRQQELSLGQRSLCLRSLQQKEETPENGGTEIEAKKAQGCDASWIRSRAVRVGWGLVQEGSEQRLDRRRVFKKPECRSNPDGLWGYTHLIHLALEGTSFVGQTIWSCPMSSFTCSFCLRKEMRRLLK